MEEIEQRKENLRENIEMMTRVIEDWKAANDPEIQWVVYVLEYVLERYKKELKQLVH